MKKRRNVLLAGCVLVLLLVVCTLMGISSAERRALGIIGGADGPTAILVTGPNP